MKARFLHHFLFLGCLQMWLSPCHADFATPFLEANNKAGEVSTAHGYVVALGPETNPRFMVLVKTDTLDHVILQATAKKDVVGDSLLGREVLITARISKAGTPTIKPELEILHVDPLKSKVEPAAEVIDLGVGTVELPPGFKHTNDMGEDSTPGHFTSPDGGLVIRYDIGKLAGVYATSPANIPVVSSTELKAGDLTGLMIVYGEATRKVVVSFPKGGPANFFAEVRNKEDIEVVRKLAISFKPNP